MNNKIGAILSQLMEECDIDEVSLARQTGVPKSNISRIKLDINANPTAATLRPLAKFFNISISQLLGDEPINRHRIQGSHNPESFTMSRLPILEWNWITAWLKNNCADYKQKLTHWISTNRQFGENSFSLLINSDEFGSILKKNSLIFIDPAKDVEYGDIILAQIDQILCLKQLIIESGDLYAKSLNPIINSSKLIQRDAILGVIYEIKYNINYSKATHLKSSSNLEKILIDSDLPLGAV